MTITLERATAKDIEMYLEIERSVDGTPTYSAMTNRDEALTEFEKSVIYFIREGDRTVGSVMYEMKSPDHVHINGLAIYPKFQSRGIGTAAMVKILEELKDIPTVDLVVHPNNGRAIKLYESLGFKQGERIENYFGDGEPRVVMALKQA